jgi:hypothetical protein
MRMKICSTLTPKGNALNVRVICGHISTVVWLYTYAQCKHPMLITIWPERGALNSSIYYAICKVFLTDRTDHYDISNRKTIEISNIKTNPGLSF